MRVQFRVFRSNLESWENLFGQAAEFASQVGPDRLIGISHSEDTNEGVVAVWYWSSAPRPAAGEVRQTLSEEDQNAIESKAWKALSDEEASSAPDK